MRMEKGLINIDAVANDDQLMPKRSTSLPEIEHEWSIRHEVPRYIGGHSLERVNTKDLGRITFWDICYKPKSLLMLSNNLKPWAYVMNNNALGYSTFLCNPDLGCYRLVSEPGYREPVVMSSASSAVTYTSVYTDSEPGRAFWGADDEEVFEGGIPRVIVYGYDGLPIQPVAPPSPDYIPGPEDPQTLPIPQDEDEREPMFDPEEDPEEYEDDETEDGLVDYPINRGDDGDDDDGDSSGDDTDDEEEEEHLALADSTIVIPTDEPVSPPEGTEPAIPPPFTNITIGARITVRP
ncbi:hypothetical protein Tco_1036239 [Tanacetum coccineum]